MTTKKHLGLQHVDSVVCQVGDTQTRKRVFVLQHMGPVARQIMEMMEGRDGLPHVESTVCQALELRKSEFGPQQAESVVRQSMETTKKTSGL